jgi:hypothetical protein
LLTSSQSPSLSHGLHTTEGDSTPRPGKASSPVVLPRWGRKLDNVREHPGCCGPRELERLGKLKMSLSLEGLPERAGRSEPAGVRRIRPGDEQGLAELMLEAYRGTPPTMKGLPSRML